MTTPTVAEIARPARSKTRTRPTCASSLREDILAMLADAKGIQWPDPRYWEKPAAFAEEILGMQTWSRQRDILDAYVAHKRVSVTSGHKIGKSNTAAIIALHFYCSKDDARVVFTSTTSRQVDAILWRELGKIRSKAGCCLACRRACALAKRPEPRPCPHSSLVGGTMNSLARSGFRAPDFREISGFTARDAEAVAGISGANLLYLPDEASGIDEAIFQAIEGNRAGGGRIVMFSNPTRTEGEFYRSQTDKALRVAKDGTTTGFYYAIQVSSEETPNVVEKREVIPGLATHEWVAEKAEEWGVDSPLYQIRVRGKFVKNESGKIISVALITEAEGKWADTVATGAVSIGVDPAGESVNGDETAFAVRRGLKICKLFAKRAQSADAIVTHVLDLITEFSHETDAELPTVSVDCEGEIGIAVTGRLAALPDQEKRFRLVRVKASNRMGKPPYDRVRDALWGNLRDWLRSGGAIPEDVKLARELHSPAWIELVGSGLLKVTAKSDLRKELGRSPDRADAVALACWVGRSSLASQTEEEPAAAPMLERGDFQAALTYAGHDAGAVFDPYGGAG